MSQRRGPNESSRETRSNSVVITLLGLALAFLVANHLTGRLVEARDKDYARRKWQMALSLRKSPDWLVLGDSGGLMGVVPSVISSQLGGDCLNLCTLATMLKINDAWLLDTCLKQAGPPRNIVLITEFRTWPMELDNRIASALAKIPLPLGFWRRLDPPLPLSQAEGRAVLLARYVPLYANNNTLRYALADWGPVLWAKRLLGRAAPRSVAVPPLPSGIQASDQARGYAPAWPPGTPAQQAAAVASFIRLLSAEPFKVSPTNQKAAEFICGTAERLGINVWLANGPLHEDLYRSADLRTYFQAIEDYQTKLAGRYSRVHYVPGFRTFGGQHLRDECHLLPAGARLYSKQLSDDLRQAQLSSGS